MGTKRTSIESIRVTTIALIFALALTAHWDLQAGDNDVPEFSHDGLQRVIDSRAELAYVKPGVDFSRYDRFMILDCYVAFKKGWQKEYNRDQISLSGRRVTDNDMERIRRDMAELFREVFVEELTENDGYKLVDAPAVDALLIRPAIIDLEVSAPDTRGAGRSYTFVDSTGEATLYIELYDSVSGEVLARTVDHKTLSDGGKKQWANRASSRQDAKRVLRTWAGWLREHMDEAHGRGQ